MATVTKKAFNPYLVPTVLTSAAYTTPVNVTSIIQQLSYHNNSDNVVELRVYLVPAGQTAQDVNTIFCSKVASKDSRPIFAALNATLAAGDMIWATTDQSGAVSLHCTVTETS